MRAQDYQISAEKFVFRTTEASLHDAKLETKPVSYFRDALNRFCKNKASIVAAGIIALLVLFAIIAPIFSQYTVAYEDAYYAYCRPRNKVLYNLGAGFCKIHQQLFAQIGMCHFTAAEADADLNTVAVCQELLGGLDLGV